MLSMQLKPADQQLMERMLGAMSQPAVDDIRHCLVNLILLTPSGKAAKYETAKQEVKSFLQSFKAEELDRLPELDDAYVPHTLEGYAKRAIQAGRDGINFTVGQSKRFCLRVIDQFPESCFQEEVRKRSLFDRASAEEF